MISAETDSSANQAVDQESYDALKPIFDKALHILSRERGHRGTLWKRLPIEDLIALLHVKAERIRADPETALDDADDAINYAAMIAWRMRHPEAGR